MAPSIDGIEAPNSEGPNAPDSKAKPKKKRSRTPQSKQRNGTQDKSVLQKILGATTSTHAEVEKNSPAIESKAYRETKKSLPCEPKKLVVGKNLNASERRRYFRKF
jgi:hypothetical protein